MCDINYQRRHRKASHNGVNGYGAPFFPPLQKYKEFDRAVRVEEIDGLRLVKRLAENMEEMFHKKAQAMKVRHIKVEKESILKRAMCYKK